MKLHIRNAARTSNRFASGGPHNLAEAQLRSKKPSLLDIIDSLPDASLAIDLDGRVVAWNREMETMSGVKARDMLLKGNYEYAIPFYQRRRPILIDMVLSGVGDMENHYTVLSKDKDVLICEAEMVDREGRRRDIWGKASPFRNSDGQIVGAIEIVRDITSQKQLVRDLESREHELQRKSRYLEEANIALKVLLERGEREKTVLEGDVIDNVQTLVAPYIARLKKTKMMAEQSALLDVLEFNLNALVSPFLRNATSLQRNFTPRELEIAGLIRQGTKTKQIAKILSLSSKSIDFHRANLRKKLGMASTRSNLCTALRRFDR